jgi:DNA replication protein DnaC
MAVELPLIVMYAGKSISLIQEERVMDRLIELKTMPYEEYLLTPEWQQKRGLVLDRASHRCQVCNTPWLLNVHHRTYERRGEEALDDLTVLCKPCHELFHERISQGEESVYTTYTWLGERWKDIGLERKALANFICSYREQVTAYEVAAMLAESPNGTLIFYGTYGTGKTHLLAAICNALNERTVLQGISGVQSLYTSAPKLFIAIQQRMQSGEGYQILLERAMTTPFLVIDDIDKSKYSTFREEIYFAIIDARTNAELPTAISTNKIGELEDYIGGACVSRLKVRAIVVEMIGDDYREKM